MKSQFLISEERKNTLGNGFSPESRFFEKSQIVFVGKIFWSADRDAMFPRRRWSGWSTVEAHRIPKGVDPGHGQNPHLFAEERCFTIPCAALLTQSSYLYICM